MDKEKLTVIIPYNQVDQHGDIYMHGCFNINPNKFTVLNHDCNNLILEIMSEQTEIK